MMINDKTKQDRSLFLTSMSRLNQALVAYISKLITSPVTINSKSRKINLREWDKYIKDPSLRNCYIEYTEMAIRPSFDESFNFMELCLRTSNIHNFAITLFFSLSFPSVLDVQLEPFKPKSLSLMRIHPTPSLKIPLKIGSTSKVPTTLWTWFLWPFS